MTNMIQNAKDQAAALAMAAYKAAAADGTLPELSLIHISEPTRP